MKPHLNNEYKNQQVKRAGLDSSYVGDRRVVETPRFNLYRAR